MQPILGSSLFDRAIGLVAVNSVDFLEQYFSFLDQDRTVVPLRSEQDRFRIEACGLERIVVPARQAGWFARPLDLRDSPQVAQVAFTSGTEGEPKGVVLTHRNLTSTAHRIQEVMQLDSTVREYVGVPVYHSFGLGRVRAVNGVGGQCFVPERGFDLRELLQMLRDGCVNSISAVPSLWRIVLNNAQKFRDLSGRVRWIEIGSQPMGASEKSALRRLFPEARIVQHYGLTEASRSTFLVVSEAPEAQLDSVGSPTGDVEIAVNSEGRIKIRGSHVAAHLLRDGRLERATDGDGWLTTNDLGSLTDGTLRFIGRADDIINLAGVKVAPDAVEEEMAKTLPSREGYCLVRTPDPLRGDSVLIAAEEASAYTDESLISACRDSLTRLGVHSGAAIRVQRVPSIPRTDSGKPRRAELAATATASASANTRVRVSQPIQWFRGIAGRRTRTVRAVFEDVFAGKTISDDATFVTLGGDSLSYIELAMRLEELLGRLPAGWQNLSVRELSSYPVARNTWRDVDVSVVLRCVGILGVVLGHFEILDVGGATFMLLAVVGFNFARFLLPNVLRTGSTRPLLGFAGEIALPTLLVIALLQIRHHDLDMAAISLLDNWWTPGVRDRYGFWFLELLIQIALLLALVLAIRPVRDLASRRPFFFAIGGLGASIASALIVPLFWNTDHLFNRVPHMLLWVFMLGWAIHVARHPWQKILVASVAAVIPPLMWEPVVQHFWVQHGMVWIWGGLLALSLWSAVTLPKWVAMGVSHVGAASMFIYLSHFAIRNNVERLFGIHDRRILFVIAIAGGVAIWTMWTTIARELRRWWSRDAARLLDGLVKPREEQTRR